MYLCRYAINQIADKRDVVVSITAEPESLTSEPSSRTTPVNITQTSHGAYPPKQYRAKTSRRLSGRPSVDSLSPILHSVSSLSSIRSSSTLEPPDLENRSTAREFQHHVRHHDRAGRIVSQVVEWLHNEKTKKAARRARNHSGRTKNAYAAEVTQNLVEHVHGNDPVFYKGRPERAASNVSEEGLALEQLEQILFKGIDLGADGNAISTEERNDSHFPRRLSKAKRQGSKILLRKASTLWTSDKEYQEPDIDVPSAEVVLDNSKTIGYSGGNASSALEIDLSNPKKRAVKERAAWLQFKHEILRLAHTLRLKGWRRLPLEKSGDLEIERLSGAMTNAVYVVSPPRDLLETPSIIQDSAAPPALQKAPP